MRRSTVAVAQPFRRLLWYPLGVSSHERDVRVVGPVPSVHAGFNLWKGKVVQGCSER